LTKSLYLSFFGEKNTIIHTRHMIDLYNLRMLCGIKVVLYGLRLSCMTLHCFVTYFDGWEGFSLWSAVFTRNASSRSSLTLIAETQPPGSWLFYNLHPGTCSLCSSGWLPAKTCPWPLHSWRSTGRAYVCIINSWEKKLPIWIKKPESCTNLISFLI